MIPKIHLHRFVSLAVILDILLLIYSMSLRDPILNIPEDPHHFHNL